jgi:hypothetical protein
VLGVLKVIFRRDSVAVQGFGTRQFQVTLIISLRILRRLQGVDAGGDVFPGSYSSLHDVPARFNVRRSSAAAAVKKERL